MLDVSLRQTGLRMVHAENEVIVKEPRSLRNLFKLSHRVRIYSPTRNHAGVILENPPRQITLEFLTDACGGATVTPAVGCWRGISGLLVQETVDLVFAYREHLDADFIDKLLVFCEGIKLTTSQESIAVEIDGEMYFV